MLCTTCTRVRDVTASDDSMLPEEILDEGPQYDPSSHICSRCKNCSVAWGSKFLVVTNSGILRKGCSVYGPSWNALTPPTSSCCSLVVRVQRHKEQSIRGCTKPETPRKELLLMIPSVHS